MTVSTRTRFEVFKRDRFVCAYCGAHPPEALMHVDHIVPVAAGGGDEITNLITACSTCNLGKAARLLEEGTAPVIGRATTEEMLERAEQAKAYMEAVAGLQAVIDNQVAVVLEHWATTYHAEIVEKEDGTYWSFGDYGRFPDKASVKNLVRRLPLDQMMSAVDITAAKFHNPNISATKYFFGICWRRVKERDGQG